MNLCQVSLIVATVTRNAEQKRPAAHAPYMQCSALPSQHARSRSYANLGIRVSHQTSHIFTRTLSECDIVRVYVAIVYGDDSFVASV